MLNISYFGRVFEREGVKVVVDDISYDFVKGATIDYVEELIRSAFVVRDSFSVFLLLCDSFIENLSTICHTFTSENLSGHLSDFHK